METKEGRIASLVKCNCVNNITQKDKSRLKAEYTNGLKFDENEPEENPDVDEKLYEFEPNPTIGVSMGIQTKNMKLPERDSPKRTHNDGSPKNISKEELVEMRNEYSEKISKILFTTYDYCSTGVSMPQRTVIVFATPRKAKMIQIIGRIERLGGDNKIERNVYDFIDVKSIYKGQFQIRNNTYQEKEYTIA